MTDMQVEEQPTVSASTLTPPPELPQPATAGAVNGVQEVEKGGQENGTFQFTGKVVQITNVSPGATLQQLATLFGFLGTVTDIRMYPTVEDAQIKVKLCYIKYESSEQCGVAQHLTNTVFIDKPLIVVPMNREEIPEESECKHLISTINAYASTATTGYLPQFFPPESGDGGLPGLPPPPIITSTTDPVEIEEIKRTIFVENIAESLTSEQMMAFFSGVGEIKYLRFVKGERRYCFIEFTNLQSVPTALQYNGVLFGGECLKVEYSKSPIVKPESERIASGRNAIRKSTRDVVKRPSSAEPRRPDRPRVFTSRSRSRSRSKSRRRSRSRDRRSRRSRSRSRSPRRSRKSRSKSRSPRRRRSRSGGRSSRRRSRSRSKSRSRSPRRRRRSRSRERRRRSRRSPSKSKSRSPSSRKKSRRKSKSRSKSRSPSPKKKSSRRSSSRSPDRSSSKKKKSKDKDRDKDKDNSSSSSKKEKEKGKEGDKDEKELKNLLTKIYTFEEEKEREKKKGSGSDESVSAAAKKE